MEMSMYSINNIKVMEVIDINTGSKLGFIKDFKIDCENYKIEAILLPTQKSAWFGKLEMIEIPWSKVKKVGVDVILVDADIVRESSS
ncbi:YlmC/YmxH family sporulation protein [Clostridium sp. 19966]|uniref:YlmC/YmxH family sporulation protein n=1 Tax=Clostridium sp. 19966 TaxID=2768166 RepID=UPI0028DEB9A6|nr:YlmC/YmxH family sporulation protein [Clostridium sp. 19966]MDT8718141.1 YlmC/YmxH family sporulation protein [Clostridium sp. 19966]